MSAEKATEQVPPIADEMPTPVPEKPQDTSRLDTADPPIQDKGYRQPEVDVAALRTLLSLIHI